MSIEITLARKAPARAELVGLAITSDEVGDKPHGLDWDVLEARGFDGSVGQAHIVSSEAGPVVALGMGAAEEMNATAFRRAGVALVTGVLLDDVRALLELDGRRGHVTS